MFIFLDLHNVRSRQGHMTSKTRLCRFSANAVTQEQIRSRQDHVNLVTDLVGPNSSTVMCYSQLEGYNSIDILNRNQKVILICISSTIIFLIELYTPSIDRIGENLAPGYSS